MGRAITIVNVLCEVSTVSSSFYRDIVSREAVSYACSSRRQTLRDKTFEASLSSLCNCTRGQAMDRVQCMEQWQERWFSACGQSTNQVLTACATRACSDKGESLALCISDTTVFSMQHFLCNRGNQVRAVISRVGLLDVRYTTEYGKLSIQCDKEFTAEGDSEEARET